MSSMRRPLWHEHYADLVMRIVETHGGTLRIMVDGGQIEIGHAQAEDLAGALVEIGKKRRTTREQDR